MNKNSLIGIILIIAVLVGWSVWMTPSKEEMARQRHIQDSINQVNKRRIIEDSIRFAEAQRKQEQPLSDNGLLSDDEQAALLRDRYGAFAGASTGEEQLFTIENEVVKLTISSKGGYVKTVELKEYFTWDSLPLVGFDENTSVFNLSFFASNRNINTSDLYFKPYLNGEPYSGDNQLRLEGDRPMIFSLRANADSYSETEDPSKYIEFAYTLQPSQYMVDFNVNTKGMKDIIASNTSFITLDWAVDLLQQEKAVDRFNGSAVYYKYLKDEVESLKETAADDEEDLRSSLKWISFKQRFFSYSIIAKEQFDNATIGMKTVFAKKKTQPRYLKTMYSSIEVPYNGLVGDATIPMSFYFGPNKLKTLQSYGIDLDGQIPLGGWLVAWINRYIVVNVFNWLGQYGWSYGIVILVLTIVIKICLMPFAFKSYMSSAKMRVLKPEIDEIGAKYPKQEDAMKKQQAVMNLYKKAGASPTSGCLPLLLQMPIIWALFRFFPSCIELRQQPFLWAHDLSTYDSVLDFSFNIPFYGDHVSLFALLMTLTTIGYTYVNNKQMQATQQSMPGMKLMLYLMPIFLLGVMNSYSSGLSYYYMLSQLITIGQTYLFRLFIDEDKLRSQIEKAKLKPVKKSNFQKRLEEMQKQQRR